MIDKNGLVCIFAFLGIIFLLGIIVFAILCLVASINYSIEELIRRYKYKHRFDAPPTAKCYCRDCVRWNHETGECSDNCNSRRMADSWFCCFAEPLNKTALNNRDKMMGEIGE